MSGLSTATMRGKERCSTVHDQHSYRISNRALAAVGAAVMLAAVDGGVVRPYQFLAAHSQFVAAG